MKTLAIHGCLTLSIVAAIHAPRTALADPGEAAFAIKGAIEPRDLETVTQAATKRLRKSGWDVSKPLARKETEALLECFNAKDALCLPAARGIRRALIVTAEVVPSVDGTRGLVLTGKILMTETPDFVVLQRRCEPCNDDTLEAASTGLTEKLLQELAVRAGRTLVSIRSNPQGANITLDGEPAGATPMNTKTFPGSHILQISKSGYLTVSRPVDAVEGRTIGVAVDLQLVTGESHRRDDDKVPAGWWHVPTAVVVGGSVFVLGGVALVFVGQQDGPDDRNRYTRATPIGVGIAVIGLGAAAYGGYRLWQGPKKAGPTVDASPNGAIVGWAGSF
jgi:hypothetical protein